MIPKINKYDFYLYSDFGNGDNPHALIQLIAHSNEFLNEINLSTEAQKAVSKRVELCEILYEDEWASRNGKVQFFFDFTKRKFVEEYYNKLILYAKEFNFESEIPNLEKTVAFYIENEAEIRELAENQDDDDWFDNVQALEAKYKYYYYAVEKIAHQIVAKPDDFCRDEEGKSIDPNYTGKYKDYLKNGILKREYSVVNGQILGEFIEYDNTGNKRKLSIKDGYFDEEIIKSWYDNGQIEFEKINSSDYIYWHKNGQKETERIGDVLRKWDDQGNIVQ